MIYYCYYRSTGQFAGSGITEYNTSEIGSTTIPCPEYEENEPLPIWNGVNWKISTQ